MLFSELYSAYYNAVAEILALAVERPVTEAEMTEITRRHAFAESALAVVPALKGEKWQLISKNMTTPLEHAPTLPLTLLERRWLKAVLLDPRIRLFDVEITGLEDVEPLFTPEDYLVYDKYSDGDDYSDEAYIRRFRLILNAVRSSAPLAITMLSSRGKELNFKAFPERLEYSEKDDKFRVILSGSRSCSVANLSRITSCEPCRGAWSAQQSSDRPERSWLTLELFDERNALERVMLHFAHFEKQAERIGERLYRVRICYDMSDETEMVIRVLSFGPVVRVTEPEDFIRLVADRLRRQKMLTEKMWEKNPEEKAEK